MGNFKGKGAAHGKVWGLCAEIPFGMLSWMNPRKHTLDEGSDHPQCARAMGGPFGNGRPTMKCRDLLPSGVKKG